MPGVASLDQEGGDTLVAYPDALIGRPIGQAGLAQDAVQEGDIVSRAVDDLGVCVDQTLGLGLDRLNLENLTKLLRRLVGALFGLALQAVEQGPGGGALRVIAMLVVAALLRHRARPWLVFMCKVRRPHPA